MKFLGVDYGDKRVGIAVSDEGGVFAFPRAVLPNTKKIFDEIKKICAEEKIEKSLLAFPFDTLARPCLAIFICIDIMITCLE